MGGLLGALGILALALSVVRYRRLDPLLAAFGAFALLYGVRQFVNSELMPRLGVSGLTTAWVSTTITYLINVPSWLFFWRLLGPGWRSILPWWLGVLSVFVVNANLVSMNALPWTWNDVSGHGVPEALLASMVKVAASSHIESGERSWADSQAHASRSNGQQSVPALPEVFFARPHSMPPSATAPHWAAAAP